MLKYKKKMKFSTIALGTAIAIASLGENEVSAFSFVPTQFLTTQGITSNSNFPTSETALSMVASEIAPSGMKRKRTKQERLEAASKGLQVHVVGLSIHHASVEVREKLAIPEDNWNAVSNDLIDTNLIAEAAILSTCNRFEVYYAASNAREAMAAVTKYLSARSGLSVSVLRKNLFMLSGDDAVWHVMRVSGGLDSLIVGEGQILSQVKQCYYHSIDDDGCGGKVLSRMLNCAVAAGKRVRSETAIAKGSVSISSAAVELAEMLSMPDLNLPFSEARLAVVGAGKMTRLLITHLASRGLEKITIVNRSLGRPNELKEQFPDVDIEVKLVEDLWDVVGLSDIVFTATSSTGYLIDEALLEENGLAGGRPLMLVDISVPRNVADDCKMVPNVSAYNVDDLKAVVAKNTAMRQREMIEAEILLREESSSYIAWRQSLSAVPTINQLQEKANLLRKQELEKCTKKLNSSNPNLSDKELEAVERLSRGIVNKLLHGPMAHLRKTESIEDKQATLKEINSMFMLEEETTNGRTRAGSRRK